MKKYMIMQDRQGYWRAGTEAEGRFWLLDAPELRSKELIIHYLLAISRGGYELEEVSQLPPAKAKILEGRK